MYASYRQPTDDSFSARGPLGPANVLARPALRSTRENSTRGSLCHCSPNPNCNRVRVEADGEWACMTAGARWVVGEAHGLHHTGPTGAVQHAARPLPQQRSHATAPASAAGAAAAPGHCVPPLTVLVCQGFVVRVVGLPS